ncbi:branched-chain amino acid ABC transporter substrate-binding protein [Streptomyces aurantiacus]|uniref:Putative Leu-binding protein like protein n=1 Tax=Streptomyces aurantiacus JA 4570 TaxID=1286094 RepID=S3ZP80_9ACTN|nr:branched-chain amino acid ABC transporter substrate-binding protein [Streptomyces aurantiacus]EPH45013.1 putative Leu-binding protein like protein [Streptomyces aurantiacus JA 4570]
MCSRPPRNPDPRSHPPGETYTAFTGELITALSEGIPRAPDPMDMDTVYRHLHRALAAKSRPLPQQRNRNTGGLIALARNRAAPPPEPTPEPRPPETAATPRGGRPSRRVRNRVIVPLAALGVVTAASLGVWLTTGGEKGGGSGKPPGGQVVTIGLDAPLTGKLAPLGRGIRNSADLAVRRANEDGAVDGVTFELKPLDDKAQPATGQENGTELIADDTVIGVVGPVNSGVAQSMQKDADDADLALVSPTAADPVLTQGWKWQTGKKSRPFRSFYRTVPTDAHHGVAAAQHLYNDDDKKKAFVVDDKKVYGAGVADAFRAEFTRLGGKVVGSDHIDPDNAGDFPAVAAEVKNSGADVFFYGGEYPAAGPLNAQLRKAGADIPLAGGDGIYSEEFIDLAGRASEGALTVSVPHPEQLASARQFVKSYRQADYRDDHGIHGAYAYDATWAIVQAVKDVTDAHGGRLPKNARAEVVSALRHVSFDGATGTISFDKYGDATNAELALYRVEDGEWKSVERDA